jgi:hypothetical protein
MLGRGLLKLLGAYSKPQQLRNGASVLYQGVTDAAENTELQEGESTAGHCCAVLCVAPCASVQRTYTITTCHVYILVVHLISTVKVLDVSCAARCTLCVVASRVCLLLYTSGMH